MKIVNEIKKPVKTTTPRRAPAKSQTATTPRATTPATIEAKKVDTKAASASRATAPVTTIEAKIDVGFGNSVYVRGQGDGLSWERGVPLKCVDGQTWQWTGPVAEKLTFKLLLNDSVWSQGEDLVAKAGQKVEVVPSF